MALADALAAVIADWTTIDRRLTAEQRDTARRLLAAYAHGGEREPQRLLKTLLAAEPPDHPAWRALTASSQRAPSEGRSTGAVAMELRRLIELSGPDRPGNSPAWIASDAEHRIWLVPMRSVPEQDEIGRILVLEHDGETWAPLFQFDAEGRLRPRVAEINQLLEADADPWGAASWWLTPHAALHAIPADALVAGRADEVLAAATAAGR